LGKVPLNLKIYTVGGLTVGKMGLLKINIFFGGGEKGNPGGKRLEGGGPKKLGDRHSGEPSLGEHPGGSKGGPRGGGGHP